MSTLSVKKEKETEFQNIYFENCNATTWDLYNINLNNIQSNVFQTNSSYFTFAQMVQQNVSKIAEVDEWFHFYEIMNNWRGVLLVTVFCTFILVTIMGNTLVILAVITTRRLKTVTNCFVMSLAVADLLVGIFVMPPAVAVHLKGSWQLGWILCDIWISLDVLLCTASILSLCAISVDRYLAVTQPLTYSRKRRSKRLASIMILIVWATALAITCPPMLGWYEPGRRDLKECRYNQHEGYVIFSAMGSFFIPMMVMIYVYAKISCVIASRHDDLTDIKLHNNKKLKTYTNTQGDSDEKGEFFGQKAQSAARTLSEDTTGKEQNELNVDDSTLIVKKNSHEFSASALCTRPCKRPIPSKNWTAERQSSTGIYRTNSMRHYANSTNHQRSLSNRISLLKKENKTTQTLSIVVGGFIACWLPFFVYYLLTPFLKKDQVSLTLTKVLTWLGWFNSAINPFIYAFYSVDFRAAFWRLTLKKICRNSSIACFPSNTMSVRR